MTNCVVFTQNERELFAYLVTVIACCLLVTIVKRLRPISRSGTGQVFKCLLLLQLLLFQFLLLLLLVVVIIIIIIVRR